MPHWEFKEITVALEFHGNPRSGHLETRRAFAAVVLPRVNEEGRGGWQPDEATDFESMLGRGRIETVRVTPGLWSTGPRRYKAVDIRLKRLVQD